MEDALKYQQKKTLLKIEWATEKSANLFGKLPVEK